VPHESRFILESATGQGGSEKEKETYGDRMHRYTALLRQSGLYTPKDNTVKRTGALLSDLDRLVMAFSHPGENLDIPTKTCFQSLFGNRAG
jgi:hypothetical protein